MESAHATKEITRYQFLHLMLQIQKEIQAIKDDIHSLRRETPQSLDEEWISGGQVMKMLKISKVTLQKYRDEEILPFSQNKGKIYYKAIDVSALLRANYNKPPRNKKG